MKNGQLQTVHVVGGGLAGSEAAWQLAQAGVPVVLHEMRPLRGTPAHKTDGYAELVCSNSFRSDDCEHNAVGLLHEEMRRLGSLIMRAADENQVPAGGALAVDRDGFSAAVTAALQSHPLVTLERGEVIPRDEWDSVIIATGPLTSPDLASAIARLTGQQQLAFFDAIAPIVHRDSIDLDQAWFQSRYDKSGPGGSGADYINCPLSREQYHAFVAALLAGDKTSFHEWETNTPYFDGCLPIEVMAERGLETLRHGPMKPFGLTNPRQPENKPYAVVQLRQDNKLGTLFNMVGFQTKLKHAEQVRVFRTIPGSKTRSSRGWAAFIAIRSSIRQPCSIRVYGSRRIPVGGSPARSPAARVMSSRPLWACLRGALPPRNGAMNRSPCRRRQRRTAHCSLT